MKRIKQARGNHNNQKFNLWKPKLELKPKTKTKVKSETIEPNWRASCKLQVAAVLASSEIQLLDDHSPTPHTEKSSALGWTCCMNLEIGNKNRNFLKINMLDENIYKHLLTLEGVPCCWVLLMLIEDSDFLL